MRDAAGQLSPLFALSNDVTFDLSPPLREIGRDPEIDDFAHPAVPDLYAMRGTAGTLHAGMSQTEPPMAFLFPEQGVELRVEPLPPVEEDEEQEPHALDRITLLPRGADVGNLEVRAAARAGRGSSQEPSSSSRACTSADRFSLALLSSVSGFHEPGVAPTRVPRCSRRPSSSSRS